MLGCKKYVRKRMRENAPCGPIDGPESVGIQQIGDIFKEHVLLSMATVEPCLVQWQFQMPQENKPTHVVVRRRNEFVEKSNRTPSVDLLMARSQLVISKWAISSRNTYYVNVHNGALSFWQWQPGKAQENKPMDSDISEMMGGIREAVENRPKHHRAFGRRRLCFRTEASVREDETPPINPSMDSITGR